MQRNDWHTVRDTEGNIKMIMATKTCLPVCPSATCRASAAAAALLPASPVPPVLPAGKTKGCGVGGELRVRCDVGGSVVPFTDQVGTLSAFHPFVLKVLFIKPSLKFKKY